MAASNTPRYFMRMRTVERLSITLPADMARMIRAKVEEGKYATSSEVIREALRAWQEREERRQARLERIRQPIREAAEVPGPSLSEEEVDAALDAMFTEGARGAA